MEMKTIIILQNKIDLLKKEGALKHKQQIENFVKRTPAGSSPIVPISAQLAKNIDLAAYYIAEYIPDPKKNLKSTPLMTVIRSFDINRPGTKIN